MQTVASVQLQPETTKKKREAPEAPPGSGSQVWSLENDLRYQCYAANSTAEERVRPQEVRIRRQHVPSRGGCGGDARSAENIPIAESEVRVVENVEHVRSYQKILSLSKVGSLSDRQVQHVKAWREEAVPTYSSYYPPPANNIFCGRITPRCSISGQVAKGAVPGRARSGHDGSPAPRWCADSA
jgi:hypothetical protein